MEAAEEKEDSKKNNVKQTKRKTDKRKDKSMASGKAFMYETIYNDLLEGIRNGTYPAGNCRFRPLGGSVWIKTRKIPGRWCWPLC